MDTHPVCAPTRLLEAVRPELDVAPLILRLPGSVARYALAEKMIPLVLCKVSFYFIIFHFVCATRARRIELLVLPLFGQRARARAHARSFYERTPTCTAPQRVEPFTSGKRVSIGSRSSQKKRH